MTVTPWQETRNAGLGLSQVIRSDNLRELALRISELESISTDEEGAKVN